MVRHNLLMQVAVGLSAYMTHTPPAATTDNAADCIHSHQSTAPPLTANAANMHTCCYVKVHEHVTTPSTIAEYIHCC